MDPDVKTVFIRPGAKPSITTTVVTEEKQLGVGEGEGSNKPAALEIADLSPEQRIAYQKFVQGSNLFITGPGGTGKTRLIRNLVTYAESANIKTAVCAMTGCAAVLLNCGARTLHSWSGIKLATGTPRSILDRIRRNKNLVNAWRSTKVLILDEISMLSRRIFELVEEIARTIRGSSRPFGGLQVVFTGDFFQLPPIGDDEQFCFESPIWNHVFPRTQQIELTTMFRQRDPLYIQILLEIRRGEISEESSKLLAGYVNREYDPANHNGCVPTKLFPLRSKVDYVNTVMFAKLATQEHVFEVTKKYDCLAHLESGKAIPAEIIKKCALLSAQDIDYEISNLIHSTPCIQILRLKVGAAVMCTINLDMEQSICNGSQGIIIDIIDNGKMKAPVVRFANGIIKTIVPHFWQSDEYPTIAISQYPLCLAWALTIHKIQGATLEMAEIDIGQGIFEFGQTYVALSRIQSLGGLYLSAFQPQKIRSHPKVVEFYKNLATGPMS